MFSTGQTKYNGEIKENMCRKPPKTIGFGAKINGFHSKTWFRSSKIIRTAKSTEIFAVLIQKFAVLIFFRSSKILSSKFRSSSFAVLRPCARHCRTERRHTPQ